jgi:hypothetical protein
MKTITVDRDRIRNAWEGRISGCQLGKSVEVLSIAGGKDSLIDYLKLQIPYRPEKSWEKFNRTL